MTCRRAGGCASSAADSKSSSNNSVTADPARALRKAIATALRRAQRKSEKLQAEQDDCDHSGFWRECGEIIKANLAEIQRGMTEVSLPDPYHPGRERTIELEAHLKPMDNARRYFKRYRKLEKGREHIASQLEKCRSERDELEMLRQELEEWLQSHPPADQVPEELTSKAAGLRIHVAGLKATGDKGGNTSGNLTGIRKFISADNMTILVGKSARDNDRLSLHLAKGNDWWFHVAHQTGSHVVVRGTCVSGQVPREHGQGVRDAMFLPQETLLDAATLAIYFSKHRRASKAEVHYTQTKHVRKSRRSPAGQVTLAQYQTILVRVEPSRLDRLLRGPSTQTG